MKKVVKSGFILLFQLIGTVLAGQTCTTSEGGETKFCSNGCCGRYPNEHCCEITVWIIVLGAVGGVVVIGIFAGVMCCCLMKKRFRYRSKTGPSQSVSEASRSSASLYRKDSLKSTNGSKIASRPPPLPMFFGKGPVYIHKRGNDNNLPPIRALGKPKTQDAGNDNHHLAIRRPSYPYPHVLHIDQKMQHESGYNSPGSHSPGPNSPSYKESGFNSSQNFAHGHHVTGHHEPGHRGEEHHVHGYGNNGNHAHSHHDSGIHTIGHLCSGHYVNSHVDPGDQHNHDLEPKDIL